jgi:DNA-binding transcriptional regulator YiaG
MSTPIDEAVAKALARRGLPSPEERRRIRQGAGLSQGDIADALGVDWSTVSRWEAGVRDPDGANVGAYAELLDRLRRVVAG